MNVKSILGTVGVVAALVLGAVGYSRSGEVVVNVPPVSPTPVQVVNNVPKQDAPVVKETRVFGALSTLDGVDNPYFSVGGVRRYYYSQNIAATSSTICSIRNPFNSTSTLQSYTIQVTTNGIGSAQTIDVSTSTTNLATSSPAFVKEFAAGAAQFSLVWSGGATTTTRLIGQENGVTGKSWNMIAPGEYVNARISTSTAGTFGSYYTGTCKGEFLSL